ncbi:hypothetical protein M9H77_04336 [Catharanthus roseus]|uniref:Uncharacterized protein n=1 Tax=Catharanthus roseus TaxID=4058 RepID=A0ACC0CDP8_CATRO|nr:hypothetical protein M9H77_04336 [Catharanthus roseus]
MGKSTPKAWQPKTLAIKESKDLRQLPTEELRGSLLTYVMKIKRLDEIEDEDRGRKDIAPKVNDDDHTSSSNNEDEIEDMALVMRKFKRFYKKDFNKRGKNPPFKKGGQSSSLFKARCFECNSTGHLITDCSKAIEKEKGVLEENLEALKKKKKSKGLIGAWDQDTSENEGDEKGNICFMAMENEVQSSPYNSFNLVDDNCDVDPSSMLIVMYDECKKVSKRNKVLKNKTQFLLDEN